MAKRKINKDEAKNQPLADNVHIKGAGSVQDEVITNTLTDNFMPYAMSIILSRAIPQIDGLNRRTENFFIQCIIWGFCKAEQLRVLIL